MWPSKSLSPIKRYLHHKAPTVNLPRRAGQPTMPHHPPIKDHRMSGYPALLGALPFTLPRAQRVSTQQLPQAYPYANTAKVVSEAEDRILRSLVFAPLTFPFSAPALLLKASLEICTAAMLDTALLPAELQNSRPSARVRP